MIRKYSDMNQYDALYKVARVYPGGLEALAQPMDISANVLRNKLAPGIESHYPSFEEVLQIVDLCRQPMSRMRCFPCMRCWTGTVWPPLSCRSRRTSAAMIYRRRCAGRLARSPVWPRQSRMR